jgi:hypothetical protein
MGAAPTPCCPVCGAGFRADAVCPRCGADLRALMELIAAAWTLRCRARAALETGALGEAARLARAAADLHATDPARRLLLVATACDRP